MILLEKGEGGLKEEGYVDCGQIRTADKDKRLITKYGSLDKTKILEIDKALMISLSIEEVKGGKLLAFSLCFVWHRAGFSRCRHLCIEYRKSTEY